MFERARDLRLRFTKGFGNLCALNPFNVTKQQGVAPFFWQSGQSLVHAQPKFFYSCGLLRRRNFNVRKHVLKLQVFVRLVKIENFVAQRGDRFDRRGLRNILLYMNAAVTLRFSSLDFRLKLLCGQLDQPTADFSPGSFFDKLAVSSQQHRVHHVLRGQFAQDQVAHGLKVSQLVADKFIEWIQVLARQ